MPVSDAQMRAKKKWESKSYDTLNIRVDKGEREKMKAFAECQGKSLNGFAKEAIYNAMGETLETESNETE